MEVNATIEDYLRAAYRLESRSDRVTNAALARELNVSAAAVTDMVRRLDELGVLHYEKYQGVKLTDAGLEISMKITRRHRLWEVFLIQHLGFEWDQVHELADQLEHITSDVLTDRLDEFLGYPTHDPHGDPIPTKDGVVPTLHLVPISDLASGDRAVVERVSDEYPELLRYASSLGLSIKSHITVLERIQFDSSVRLMADGKESVISEKLASSVFVQLERSVSSRKTTNGRTAKERGTGGSQ